VARYIVEAYLAADPAALEHARAAARHVSAIAPAVRYVRTIFLPDDETVFHMFDAPSASAVREPASAVSMHVDRLAEAVEGDWYTDVVHHQ
jgi:hypothetical protein